MGLSHRKSGMIGLYRTIRSSRDESKQFQMAAAVICSFVPMTAYPECCRSQRPILGTFQSRRMRLNVDAQRRHDSHTSLRSTHLLSHLSMTLPIRLQSLVSCNDPGRRLPIATLPSRVNPTTSQLRKLFVASPDSPDGLCIIIFTRHWGIWSSSITFQVSQEAPPTSHYQYSTITILVFARRAGNQKQ
jgi:hypothetical protein